MEDFDAALVEDRSFKIGGEVFKWRYPHPSETQPIFQKDLDSLFDAEAQNGSAETMELGGITIVRTNLKDDLEDTQKRIAIFIDREDGALERWNKLTKRRENPIPGFQYRDLYNWLIQVTSGRPTNQPLDSVPGAGRTEASSTDASPSPEENQPTSPSATGSTPQRRSS